MSQLSWNLQGEFLSIFFFFSFLALLCATARKSEQLTSTGRPSIRPSVKIHFLKNCQVNYARFGENYLSTFFFIFQNFKILIFYYIYIFFFVFMGRPKAPSYMILSQGHSDFEGLHVVNEPR